ncbi:MAG: LptF/LptG family permease [Prevotella sp.]|nr:LptF/LptG family permease [Prevotella sp.]
MFRIRKLDIFIVKQFGLLFVGTFFICQFVLMMQFLWQHVDKLIGKGLSVEVLAQFFWYMGLFLVPQALPLAILLSSLITFGNLGESSELTAIKSAGISLMQALRPLMFVSVLIACGSFYFQNNAGPHANQQLTQLLVSMKQQSPELEIPEGVFYDGLPNCNIYVQKKNLDTGKLYGIMIYRMTSSYEDAAIILADSGMLQSTAEKKHLVLNLYSGEWFENMRSQELAGSVGVPYRRESFWHKTLVIDFDREFNLADAGSLANNARGKSLSQLHHDIDSLNHYYDSIGHVFYNDAKQIVYNIPNLKQKDSLRIAKMNDRELVLDSMFAKHSNSERRAALNTALARSQQQASDLEFRSMLTSDGDKIIRQHRIEKWNKFTLALSCIIFFFIGAPLGAIIRKGGLGVPIIISVLVFIIYYILDNTGYRMARGGIWAVWFGKGIATAVLAPVAIFFTYKANNDSAVFNVDAYRNVLMRMLGLRMKRPSYGKEVIINDPHYAEDVQTIKTMNDEIERYSSVHRLKTPPNVVSTFFRYQPDNEIETMNEQLEAMIEDLSNSRDKVIVGTLSTYPVLAVKAHTRPFDRKWMNVASAVILPLGIFFYFRMWRFRRRLHRDLRTITNANNIILSQIVKNGWDK